MKIALLNDTHFGARGDSQLFFDYFMKFFDEVFFPYLKENNIDTVIHAGDLMDRRKFVNFSILNQVRTKFIQRLSDEKITVHCILGNHDVYYRNTNEINSLKELFNNDITVYDKPSVLSFGGLDIALLPLVNKTNHDESVEFIKSASAPILIGHLELDGYQVMRGVGHRGGMDPKLFDRYEKVISGHFHCRHTQGNVDYLGTQYQITFADLKEAKGFHVLDTDTRDLTFIENPYKMFHRLVYDDSSGSCEFEDLSYLEGCYVRVEVNSKKHPYSFDRLMDSLYDVGVAKITTVEDYIEIDENDKELVDLAQDTVTLINNEIDLIEEIVDKDKMKRLVKELYMESLSI